jgi:hypothetical protein
MTTPREQDKATAYAKWYDANKEKLAEKRKARYASDPEYRKKAYENRKVQLAKNRVSHELPVQYTTTFSEAAKELDVSIWKFRHWRAHSYFPEPYQYGKSLYFTDHQIDQLQQLSDFLAHYPRLPASAKEPLAELVALIYSNWN